MRNIDIIKETYLCTIISNNHMKNKNLLLAAFALVLGFTSCKDPVEPVEPTDPVNTEVVLEGNLTTQTLDATKTYLLKGTVFVPNGVTIDIPAGTVIKGEKKSKATLVVNIGGKINANGLPNNPVVFTSNQEVGERDKGDWGGVVVLGRANCNQNNPAIEGITPAVNFGTFQSTAFNGESSGNYKYMRIEYAGIALSPNNETNSLTMGGVGNGGTFEYIQVSYGGDDGFEWFGGTANGKYLVSLASWDDDYDCDFGWTGNVQFGLVVRDPFQADQSGSNGFECDNEAAGNDVQPYTSGVFSNITVYGPVVDPRRSTGNQASANYQHAMHLRRRTAISIFNSVFTGFPVGFRLDGKTTEDQYTTNGNGKVAHNILVQVNGGSSSAAAAPRPFSAGVGNTVATVEAYWNANNNTTYADTLRVQSPSGKNIAKSFVDAGINTALIMGVDFDFRNYPKDPNFANHPANAATQTGANFSDPKLPGSFFATTAYKGGFGTSDWTDGWASFFPNGEEY